MNSETPTGSSAKNTPPPSDLTAKGIGVLCVTGHSDRPEAETFIGIRELGFDICVACPDTAPHWQRLGDAGVERIALDIRSNFDREATAHIRTLLASKRFQLLHVFNNRAVMAGLRAVREFPSIGVIAYRGIVGNVSFWDPISWARYLNPRVDRIVCVAEAIRQHLLRLRFFGYRLPPEKVVTIHKGHRVDWYSATPANLESLGIPEDAFVIGCVSNHRPRKGVEILVEAFGLLPDDGRLWLLLVGNMNAASLDDAIGRSPRADRIVRTGFRQDAADLIAACDVAVLPSLRREGLPKTVIEAMAAGVAPVVTNVGGSAELVLDGSSGLVVEPGNAEQLATALRRLYADPPLSVRLGEAARPRIDKEFRVETTVQRHAELYLELAKEKCR